MTISVELEREDDAPCLSVAVAWSAHVEGKTWSARTVLSPAEAYSAACHILDQVPHAGVLSASLELELVTAAGVRRVEAPVPFWLQLANALEIVAARLQAGVLDVAQRVDLAADGTVSRSQAAVGGQ